MDNPMKGPVTVSEIRMTVVALMGFASIIITLAAGWFGFTSTQALTNQKLDTVIAEERSLGGDLKTTQGDVGDLKTDNATIKQALRDRGIIAKSIPLPTVSPVSILQPQAGQSAQLKPTPAAITYNFTSSFPVITPMPTATPEPTPNPTPFPTQQTGAINTLLDTVGKIL